MHFGVIKLYNGTAGAPANRQFGRITVLGRGGTRTGGTLYFHLSRFCPLRPNFLTGRPEFGTPVKEWKTLPQPQMDDVVVFERNKDSPDKVGRWNFRSEWNACVRLLGQVREVEWRIACYRLRTENIPVDGDTGKPQFWEYLDTATDGVRTGRYADVHTWTFEDLGFDQPAEDGSTFFLEVKTSDGEWVKLTTNQPAHASN